MMKVSHVWNPVVIVAGLLAFVGGCGGSTYTDPPVVPVAPVSGSVKFNNETPVGARVLLSPVARTVEGISSSGRVEADGTFKISTYGEGDGAPLGDYVVLVTWNKPLGGEDGNVGGPNVIPKDYSDREKSPIKFTVKEGENTIPPIVIPKK